MGTGSIAECPWSKQLMFMQGNLSAELYDDSVELCDIGHV
jgi:hypothetical protein